MAVHVPDGFDFCGYATRNDVLCADGRTIRRNAFKDQDGKKVPLVYNHLHNDMSQVIGHALLENRKDGVYCYGYLNDTDLAQKVAKKQLQHGDLTAMSIYANHLKQMAGDVVHGIIREVSLVLAGANEGAYIDWVLEHSDDGDDSAAILQPDSFDPNYFISLSHSDMDDFDDDDDEDYDPEDDDFDDDDEDYDPEDDEDYDPEDDDDFDDDDNDDDYDDDEDDEDLEHDDLDDETTVGDILDTLNENQQAAVVQLIGAMNEEEDYGMKHNIFDSDSQTGNFLSHSDEVEIIENAKRVGSLKDAYLQHCESLGMDRDELMHGDGDDPAARYGIDHIEALFPEYKNLNVPPEWIKRDTTWVPKVLNGAHHTPFSRIKSMFANLTEDEARAKGYIKGNQKKDQVFSLLKRTTDPQTVYKRQKLDRDDQIDITDFNVVAWIKSEMRGQLDEELARAMLVGDGRLPSDDDHISEEHIRPIWKDADLFAVKVTITMKAGATDDDKARAFLRANLKARKYYKGSGSPKMFTTDSLLSDVLLLEDGIGRMLYETEQAVATKCRVSEIVPVEIMEGLTDDTMGDLAAIVVNMTDYNVGADKGGAVSMFEDFDIDYNQNKYLIETRCSGALVKPYSALIFSFKQGDGANTVITFSGDGMDEFTIKDDDNSAQG